MRLVLCGGGLALVGAGVIVLRMQLAARLQANLERVTGHRVTVGGATLGWRAIVAKDVRIFGAPPFDTEPVARIVRLDLRFSRDLSGGASQGSSRAHGRSFWSPAEVYASGVDVDLLAAGGVDNVGWRRRLRTADSRAQGPGALPVVRVRNGRLRGAFRPASGPATVFRARDFSLDLAPEGDGLLALQDLVAEVSGALTVSVPALLVKRDPAAGGVSIAGDGVVLAIPGGGPLLDGVTVDGAWSKSGARIGLAKERVPASASHLAAELQLDAAGARLSVDAADLGLLPLGVLAGRSGVDLSRARASMRIRAAVTGARPDEPIDVDLGLRVSALDVRQPAIDSRAWRGMSVAAAASGSWNPATQKVEVQSGSLEVGGAAALAIAGWTELGAAARGRWTIRTPRPLSCAALVAEGPPPIREALAGLKLEGRLGLSASIAFDATAWDALALDLGLQPLCAVAAEPAALAALLPMLRAGAPLQARTPGLPLGPYHPDFVPLARMPAHLPAAFLTAEDGRFFDHNGFDVEMIRRALAHDIQTRSFAKGGSTITQQLAKNLFLSHSRTLARKIEESVFAWRLEELLDKRRMLELYLNIIELGPDIRGVKQAARAYFAKEVSELRPLESVHLAALTPNPRGYARRFRDGRVDDGWLQRLYDLLGMMNRSRRLSREDLAAARSGKLTLLRI